MHWAIGVVLAVLLILLHRLALFQQQQQVSSASTNEVEPEVVVQPTPTKRTKIDEINSKPAEETKQQPAKGEDIISVPTQSTPLAKQDSASKTGNAQPQRMDEAKNMDELPKKIEELPKKSIEAIPIPKTVEDVPKKVEEISLPAKEELIKKDSNSSKAATIQPEVKPEALVSKPVESSSSANHEEKYREPVAQVVVEKKESTDGKVENKSVGLETLKSETSSSVVGTSQAPSLNQSSSELRRSTDHSEDAVKPLIKLHVESVDSKVEHSKHVEKSLSEAPSASLLAPELSVSASISTLVVPETRRDSDDKSVMVDTPDAKSESTTDKRMQVIDEILATELTYRDHLSILVKEFLHPLRKLVSQGNTTITEDHLRTIFSNVELILGLHENLAEMLSSNKENVAFVFEKFGAFLKIYTEYVNSYDKATKTLESLKKSSKKFRNFLTSKSTKKIMDIRSYLITPIQRIPRYILLLKELLKLTPADHPQRSSLEKSYAKIQEIADFVNEAKRKMEDSGRLLEVQSHMMEEFPDLVAPHRKLLKEAKVIRKTHGKMIQKRTNLLFLCNDVIVWTTENLKYKGRIPLQSINNITEAIESKAPDSNLRKTLSSMVRSKEEDRDKDKEKQDQLGLTIFAKDTNEEFNLEVLFESEETRDDWAASIRDAIYQLGDVGSIRKGRSGSWSDSVSINRLTAIEHMTSDSMTN